MRKIKEVLRLRFELGLGQRQIARSCSIGLGTVHDYLQRAESAGVGWPLPEDWDDRRLEAVLFDSQPRPPRPAQRPLPDFAAMREQRQQHRHLTLRLLWEEYRQATPDGYGYSRFCELYQRWFRTRDVVMRQEHKAGEKLFVDWAGDTIQIYDPRGGPVQTARAQELGVRAACILFIVSAVMAILRVTVLKTMLPTEATATIGWRKIESGRSGSSARSSIQTNSPSSPALRPSRPSICGEPQGSERPPSSMATSSTSRPTVIAAAPA